MMQLIARYDFHYGLPGPNDAEAPLISRGEAFEPQPDRYAGRDEVARILIAQGAAMTPEAWAKRKPRSDVNAAWANEFVAKAREAYRVQRGQHEERLREIAAYDDDPMEDA